MAASLGPLDPVMRPPDMTRPLARLSRLAAKLAKTRTVRTAAPAPLVSFTFDDVIDTAYTCGAPILERHGARATFYVTAGLLGRASPDRAFVTADQVLDLHRRGHEIGCHTYSHAAVATQDKDRLLDDLARNRAALAAFAPDLVLESFAYPFNAATLRAKLVLQKRFGSCRGGVAGINAGRVDLGYLRAIDLCDDSIDPAGVRAWIAEAVRRRGWLVFLTHGVTADRQAWRSTPDLLEGAVAAVREHGVAIATVRDAVRRLSGAPPLARAGSA